MTFNQIIGTLAVIASVGAFIVCPLVLAGYHGAHRRRQP